MLKAPMRHLPLHAQATLRSFLFDWCQGVDREHTRRWMRIWRRLYDSRQRNPSLQLWVDVNRSRPYHARWMSLEDRLYESQHGFYGKPGMRWWLKAGAGFGSYEASAGALVFVPSSLSWEDCSDDEMREFTENALVFLQTPHALEQLWPDVHEDRRAAMLEACLNPPTEGSNP